MLMLGAMALTAITAHSQWTLQNSNSTASLRGVHSLGGGVAWASGTNGTVLRTEDGGYLWQTCTIPPGAEKLDFRGIQAFDANTAIVMSSGKGDLSRLYKTTDGCHSWKLIFTNPDKDGFWDALVLASDEAPSKHPIAVLVGDPVDGHFPMWRVWNANVMPTQVLRHRPHARNDEAAFAASNSSLFVDNAYYGIWLATGGTTGAHVYRLASHGADELSFATFPSSAVPIGNRNESSGIFSIAFIETPNPPPHDLERRVSNVGIAVGGDYTNPDESSGTAAFTTDGGKTWQAATQLPHGYRSAVAYDSATKTWITVGPNGTDISTDDGKNWHAVKPNASLNELTDTDKNWNAISLPFVVGPHGRIGKLNEPAIKAALATK
jgi:hypothetical protein